MIIHYLSFIYRNCIGQHFALNEEKVMIGALTRRWVPRRSSDYVLTPFV